MAQIRFQAARIADPPLWVIDDRDQRAKVGVGAIALDIVDQLVCDLAFAETIASHLRLDDDLLPLQHEVDSG